MTVVFNKVATKIFGSANERLLKRLWPVVAEINALEPEMERLSDDELRERTAKFREHMDNGMADAELSGATPEEQKKALRAAIDKCLDEILVEAFAVVREASRRTTGMRHFDVQLIGGMVLHRGTIAEMRTAKEDASRERWRVSNAFRPGRVHGLSRSTTTLGKTDNRMYGKIYRFLGVDGRCIQPADPGRSDGNT